jgi:hypothetical protein
MLSEGWYYIRIRRLDMVLIGVSNEVGVICVL